MLYLRGPEQAIRHAHPHPINDGETVFLGPYLDVHNLPTEMLDRLDGLTVAVTGDSFDGSLVPSDFIDALLWRIEYEHGPFDADEKTLVLEKGDDNTLIVSVDDLFITIPNSKTNLFID